MKMAGCADGAAPSTSSILSALPDNRQFSPSGRTKSTRFPHTRLALCKICSKKIFLSRKIKIGKGLKKVEKKIQENALKPFGMH